MNSGDRLTYTLYGVMHSVDKWLDGNELKQDEVTRAATMREKVLRIIESLQKRLAESERRERDAINELCQKCGRYREEHNGACDGCRWHHAKA